MCEDLSAVERLIDDLSLENLYERSEHLPDGCLKIYTSKLLIIIYLPHSNRLEIEDDRKVIHLDIDNLNHYYQKVLQRIKGLIGLGKRVFARQTVVARVDKRVSTEFLEEYHLNGPLPGKYRYGLFYQGELVSLAVFSGARVMRKISDDYRSFELIRFCNKADYLVVGGISKLVKAFVQEFKPSDIMTYADRDWSQKSSLEAIGFVDESVTDVQTFYIRNGVRLSSLESKEEYDYLVKNNGSIKLKLYLS
ncbi:hypothetical protein [Sphingobacterium bovistauri]|uniref:Uncharacterized protein n=1 Tax=Sphingobacterium bovistauri TaxID=2781959 RepID=A0ABS7Z659_9SPHI|nr:hypothetical protein [Sphingobacterium bovistauri]MCA5005632.1 hypothetical protein [Sphingobacterium bovistauri]